MKKKLKDFTEKEIDEICDKHALCFNCPFDMKDSLWCYGMDDYKKLWGDLEIEYEEL